MIQINEHSKRRLWIYGCSYSDNWNDEYIPYEETWWGLIAREFDLYVCRSHDDKDGTLNTHHGLGGQGWGRVQQAILFTANEWKEDDLVIIEEPPRCRTNTSNTKNFNRHELFRDLQSHGLDKLEEEQSEFLTKRYYHEDLFGALVRLNEYNAPIRRASWELDDDERYENDYQANQPWFNWIQYRGAIKSLANLHKNLYTWNFESRYLTWHWDNKKLNIGEPMPLWNEFEPWDRRLIFGEHQCYTEWMTNNHDYWTADWDDHQNIYGHKEQAKLFINQLKGKYGS